MKNYGTRTSNMVNSQASICGNVKGSNYVPVSEQRTSDEVFNDALEIIRNAEFPVTYAMIRERLGRFSEGGLPDRLKAHKNVDTKGSNKIKYYWVE